jgi:hypothetical protein
VYRTFIQTLFALTLMGGCRPEPNPVAPHELCQWLAANFPCTEDEAECALVYCPNGALFSDEGSCGPAQSSRQTNVDPDSIEEAFRQAKALCEESDGAWVSWSVHECEDVGLLDGPAPVCTELR